MTDRYHEHWDVTVESAVEAEYASYDSAKLAQAAFNEELAKLKPGQLLTLTKVILLDSAEGPQ